MRAPSMRPCCASCRKGGFDRSGAHRKTTGKRGFIPSRKRDVGNLRGKPRIGSVSLGWLERSCGLRGASPMLTALRVLSSRLRGLFTPKRFDREIDTELQSHLAMLTERFMNQGMPAEVARQEARRRFGGLTQVKEELRERHRLSFLDSLLQDARY